MNHKQFDRVSGRLGKHSDWCARPKLVLRHDTGSISYPAALRCAQSPHAKYVPTAQSTPRRAHVLLTRPACGRASKSIAVSIASVGLDALLAVYGDSSAPAVCEVCTAVGCGALSRNCTLHCAAAVYLGSRHAGTTQHGTSLLDSSRDTSVPTKL